MPTILIPILVLAPHIIVLRWPEGMDKAMYGPDIVCVCCECAFSLDGNNTVDLCDVAQAQNQWTVVDGIGGVRTFK